MDIAQSPFFDESYQQDLYSGRSRQWRGIAAAYTRRLLQLIRSPAFDLVWVEYELFPWLPAFGERFLRRLRVPYVVDYDDAIFHRYELHPNSGVRSVLGKKVDVIMKAATTVVVGNGYLGERARAAGAQRVEYLPTVVDIARYPGTPAENTTTFTIGWIGSPSTVRYLSLIRPVLADWCKAGRARLVVVGARETPLDGVPVDVRPWSEATEANDLSEFDVGVMPLADGPWERGKCGYKLIQYMASARPVIASPVGVNPDIVEPGVNGFLAATEGEWRSALEALYVAPSLRAELGQAGRRKVEAEYCTRVTAPRLAAILHSAVRS